MALDSNAFLQRSLYCLDHISNNMLSWHFKLKVYTVWCSAQLDAHITIRCTKGVSLLVKNESQN